MKCKKFLTYVDYVFHRVFRESGQKSGLVFIHRLQSVDDFVWELRDLGLNAVALYQKVANQDPEEYEKFLTEFQTGQINVVVGTEETVRGLDFKELDHVYLTEVARNIDAYLHQAGRVGRQGRPGTATTLVSVRNPRDEKRMQMEYRRLNLPFERIVLWRDTFNGDLQNLWVKIYLNRYHIKFSVCAPALSF